MPAPSESEGRGGKSKNPENPENKKEKSTEEKVIEQLKSCYDPEIPVNIYDLGLIYDMMIDHQGGVKIKMTLTSPNCPAVETLPEEVKVRVAKIDGVTDVSLDLVWDPPFSEEMMSDEAKLALGLL